MQPEQSQSDTGDTDSLQPDSAPFDLSLLSRAVDEERARQGLSWKQLSQHVGVATSTIRRFATASDAEADGVLALVGWLGVAPENFVARSQVGGSPLPHAGDGVIRVDMTLIAALPASPRRVRVGTRTTIQRLVSAAQASQTSIASLTRRTAI